MEHQDSRDWEDWISQADHLLAAAQDNLERGWYDVAAVLSQQAAEMAAKAAIVLQTQSAPPRTHAVDDLLRQLGATADLVDAGRGLARGYLLWRYPGITDQPPHEMVREPDSAARMADAERIIQWVKTLLPES